jgi:uridine monophosphate synthetase
MWLLVPGVGKQGGDLEASLKAGLWPNGQGLIVNSSRGICLAENPREAARDLRDRINAVRDRLKQSTRPGPSVTGLDLAIETIVLDMARIGAIRFGEFTLKSGDVSPVYIDLRLLASYPDVLDRVAGVYVRLLQGLQYDRIAAIPYAALPIGTAVSLHTRCPLIYPRKEIKRYGTIRPVEGYFERGERIVVLDDLITTGASKLEAIEPLEAAGLGVEDIVVFIDREGGGMEELAQSGYRLHSVLTLTEVLDILLTHGRIGLEQRQTVLDWLAGGSSL